LRGAYHRARIGATRWLHPGYNVGHFAQIFGDAAVHRYGACIHDAFRRVASIFAFDSLA
jgi:hypothetical protein